jgi:uncharacterized protein (UPF0335 family)
MNYEDILKIVKPTKILQDHLMTYLKTIEEYEQEKNQLQSRLTEVNFQVASLSVLQIAVENELNKGNK